MNKRIREEERTEQQSEQNIFTKSKKVLRSPEQRKRVEEIRRRQTESIGSEENLDNTKEMDELKEMMRTMMSKMEENTNELKKEINKIKTEMEKKNNEWKKEKKDLTDRIEILERKAEREERLKKRNNIIIKGLKSIQSTKEEMEKWIERELKVKVDINNVIIINKDTKNEIIKAELSNWEQKHKIMVNKKELKNTKIYIDNDLTWEERKIQREIRNIAKEEKEKGKKVKIGYQRLIINEEVYNWIEKERGLVAQRNEEHRNAKNY